MASNLKIKSLPLPKHGMDVLSPESSIAEGAVRLAKNVVIADEGQYKRRPGAGKIIDLPFAHSFWRGQGRSLAASGDSLYSIDVAASSSTAIFTGLPARQQVEYSTVLAETYFTAPGVLGKITAAGLVRRPGIADMRGIAPTLAVTLGGLFPGNYAVAYSMVNDLGEESGLSALAFINLPAGGGILLSDLLTASHVVEQRIYVSSANGTDLALYSKNAVAGTASITDQKRTRKATNVGLDAMPGGDYVRHFAGKTYVASGPWLYESEAMNYGLRSVVRMPMTWGKDITMLEPVKGGIFVGMADRVIFLQGKGALEALPASEYGAIAHSGGKVSGALFNADLTIGDQAAVWLSEYGMVIGRSDGSVVHPQSSRIRLRADSARPLFMRANGVSQGLFVCPSLTFNGAVDTTL